MAQKIVVITGCSSGIGLATAVYFAKDEQKRYKVIATVRESSKTDTLIHEAGTTLNDTLFIRKMDISCNDSVKEFFKNHYEQEERIDVLVCNAGTVFIHVFECVPMEQIQRHYNVNVFGTMRVIQACLPDMKKRNSGQIIINSSIDGSINNTAMNDVYASGKSALEGLALSLVPVLKQYNIKLSVLATSFVKTLIGENCEKNGFGSFEEMLEEAPDEKTKECVRKYQNGIMACLHKCQEPQEIAEIVSKIVCAENPSFRYFTLPADEKRAHDLFVDPSGDKYVMKLCNAFNTT